MSIKCGSCKGTHDSIDNVRRCYAAWRGAPAGSRPATDAEVQASRDRYAPPQPQGGSYNNGGRSHQPATPNQRRYIADLRAQKGLDPLGFTGTKSQASTEIDRLKGLPDYNKPVQRTYPTPLVPDGRYAVRGDDGVVKFYKVKNGYRRVFVEVYASDARYPIDNAKTRLGILEVINADVDGAAVLFGTELGRCYRCGRTLTDETSRALGIGPDCRSK